MYMLSVFAHYIKMHSANTSYFGDILNLEAWWVAFIWKNDCNPMVMQSASFEAIHTRSLCPLLRVWENMSYRVPDIQRSPPVAVHLFDLFSRNVVAPNHLITGLITNLLVASFSQLRRFTVAKRLELVLRFEITEVVMEGQKYVYNCLTSKLHSIAMSTKYCILTCSSTAWRLCGCKR